jgi:GNAT superfamily N-acetyltransferase
MTRDGADTAAPTVVTAAERPDLVEPMQDLGASPWPEFLLHDQVVNRHWGILYDAFPDYQFALLDEADGTLAAIGNCIPIAWNGEADTLPLGGIDDVLENAAAIAATGAGQTAASALMIVIEPGHLGRGLSRQCIRAMSAIVAHHGLSHVVAPVRPTEKHRYPLIEMDRYAQWRRADGALHDPWLRVHEQVGGVIAGTAPAAMTVRGTVSEWEQWTGLAMPETGQYVVPGGLVPVAIDREQDSGTYVEPSVWVVHAAAAGAARP